MAKPKHPTRRYRIRAGHSLYQVGTVGVGPGTRVAVERVQALGPREAQRTDESGGFIVAAPAHELNESLLSQDVAGDGWIRYYVYFSRRKARSFAARLQLKLDAHYHKAGTL